jgi:hypothetical protein
VKVDMCPNFDAVELSDIGKWIHTRLHLYPNGATLIPGSIDRLCIDVSMNLLVRIDLLLDTIIVVSDYWCALNHQSCIIVICFTLTCRS